MPYAMLPPGYQAHLLGSAGSLDDLGVFVPLEEGVAEGALMLMELDFPEFPAVETLANLNETLIDGGVAPWPGSGFIVFADAVQPRVYLAWQKGMAWMPVIIGMLGLTVLPALLGAFVWWVLPEPVTGMIESMIGLGVMMLMMFLMMRVIKPLTAPDKPEKIEEGE